MKKLFALTLLTAGTAVAAGLLMTAPGNPVSGAEENAAKAPKKAAVERSRKTVQLLDNIFKQTVVLVTDKYVHDEDDFAAGSAAVLLFKNVSDSGPLKVRLLDATGEPYEPKNVAKDDFEREGLKQLLAGAKTYDKVVQLDGKPFLRAITPVPVVMKKCIMCHANYADAKKGEPIGAISYSVPIE
ncbi:MAG: DUF3365 domain-containing protein [Rhodopirellula sp.]|nr:DUF3365 domain-containing protein [Rhodopirellula sp.]